MRNHNFIRIVIIGVVLVLFEQFSGLNSVYGLSLMGPPRSLLQPEENSFGIELGYSEMDLDSFGDVTETVAGLSTPDFSKYKIEKLKSIMPLVRFDTNIFENWDLFLRVGASDASGDLNEEQAGGASGHKFNDFDGNLGFSWGVGTRTTFYQQDNTTWGAIFQADWINPGDSDITDKTDAGFSGSAEISYWEVQVAIGPTVEFDNVRVYGGPFLHFVNGDLDISGTTTSTIPDTSTKVSHDIKEKSQLGGFLGAQWNLGNNNTLVTEAQFTGDAWGIGIGTTWKF